MPNRFASLASFRSLAAAVAVVAALAATGPAVLNMSRPEYDFVAPTTGTMAPGSLLEPEGGGEGPAAPPAGGAVIF